MPSSSYTSGRSSRAAISSNWNASVVMGRESIVAAMPFELPQLPYSFDALEPHIDAQTMEIHHDRHHKAYVDNANAALEGTDWADKPVEQVLADLDLLPEDKQAPVRNNAGGHANHSLFWEIMG